MIKEDSITNAIWKSPTKCASCFKKEMLKRTFAFSSYFIPFSAVIRELSMKLPIEIDVCIVYVTSFKRYSLVWYINKINVI